MYVLKIYFETFLFRKYFSVNVRNKQIRGTLSTAPSAPVLLPGVWSQGLGGLLWTVLTPGWEDLWKLDSRLDGMTKAQETFALGDSLKASVIPYLNPLQRHSPDGSSEAYAVTENALFSDSCMCV